MMRRSNGNGSSFESRWARLENTQRSQQQSELTPPVDAGVLEDALGAQTETLAAVERVLLPRVLNHLMVLEERLDDFCEKQLALWDRVEAFLDAVDERGGQEPARHEGGVFFAEEGDVLFADEVVEDEFQMHQRRAEERRKRRRGAGGLGGGSASS